MRLIAGAHHSFDRGTEINDVADASVSPAAPTAYLADDGAFIHPIRGIARDELGDRDLMVYALKAGYGRKGARIGSRPWRRRVVPGGYAGFLEKDAGVSAGVTHCAT